MTLLFVLLLQAQCSGSGCATVPRAAEIFDTREACTTYAAAELDDNIRWRCVAVPISDDQGDEPE
jgi:hypothetical protein